MCVDLDATPVIAQDSRAMNFENGSLMTFTWGPPLHDEWVHLGTA